PSSPSAPGSPLAPLSPFGPCGPCKSGPSTPSTTMVVPSQVISGECPSAPSAPSSPGSPFGPCAALAAPASSIRLSSAAVIGVPPLSPFFHLSGSNAISSHLQGRDRLRERCFHPEPRSRGFGATITGAIITGSGLGRRPIDHFLTDHRDGRACRLSSGLYVGRIDPRRRGNHRQRLRLFITADVQHTRRRNCRTVGLGTRHGPPHTSVNSTGRCGGDLGVRVVDEPALDFSHGVSVHIRNHGLCHGSYRCHGLRHVISRTGPEHHSRNEPARTNHFPMVEEVVVVQRRGVPLRRVFQPLVCHDEE